MNDSANGSEASSPDSKENKVEVTLNRKPAKVYCNAHGFRIDRDELVRNVDAIRQIQGLQKVVGELSKAHKENNT